MERHSANILAFQDKAAKKSKELETMLDSKMRNHIDAMMNAKIQELVVPAIQRINDEIKGLKISRDDIFEKLDMHEEELEVRKTFADKNYESLLGLEQTMEEL